MSKLPTELGSVVGWAKYFKGRVQFYTAVLGQGMHLFEFVWWVSGEEDPYSSEQLLMDFGEDFVIIGTVEIDPDALDLATALDQKLNGD